MPLNSEMGHDQPFASWATPDRSVPADRRGRGPLAGRRPAPGRGGAADPPSSTPRTNLPNHAALVEGLEEISNGRTGCCLLFEIADYDRVQVHFGPAHADDWARAIAGMLAAACPSGRTLYQVRAHRFCLWLPGHDVAQAIAVGTRLGDSAAPVTVRGIEMESGPPVGGRAVVHE